MHLQESVSYSILKCHYAQASFSQILMMKTAYINVHEFDYTEEMGARAIIGYRTPLKNPLICNSINESITYPFAMIDCLNSRNNLDTFGIP